MKWRITLKKPSWAQLALRHLQASWTVRRWWHSEKKDNVNLKISIKDKSPSIVDPPALLQGMSVQDWKESPKMQMVAFRLQRPAANSCCDISYFNNSHTLNVVLKQGKAKQTNRWYQSSLRFPWGPFCGASLAEKCFCRSKRRLLGLTHLEMLFSRLFWDRVL